MGEQESNLNEQAAQRAPTSGTTEAGTEPQAPPEDVAEVTAASTQLEQLVAERDRLAEEVRTLKDQLLRQRAEFDNFRRRTERERQEMVEFAAAETVRQLLPVLDDLERAVQAAPPVEGPVQEYIRGIQMIHQRFVDILTRLGLEPIESVGRPFDPTVHHAVDMVTTEEAEDHTVVEEYRKGYNFKGKLLREALVKVAIRPKS